jgi:iron-sulfur cluster insertion protein
MGMITITPAAKDKITEVVNNQGVRLRIVVSGGGCSGLQYHFEESSQCLPDDVTLEDLVVIDPISLMHLDQSVLDLNQDAFSSHLVLRIAGNRNQCGCGNSFGM